MSEERYVKQIVSDVMEMAAKIKFLEAKVAASESWNAECADDHKRELAAALRRAKAAGMREAAMRAREFSKPYFIDWWMLMTKREIVASICCDVADAINARAAQIENEATK